ncbi:MAG: isoprenyl transferase [Gammaproteobacteria bacterium]|nr:isoprenyl transferase [Gammaproteobacteria bacterium]
MFSWFKRKRKPVAPIITPKPRHVAVIMDGNGRWANAQGLSRVAGHKKGVDSVKGLIRGCLEHEIPYLSIFAFSSENWNRPQREVDALMDLFANALESQTKKLNENGVRLRLIGDLSRFSSRIQRLAEQAMQQTRDNQRLVFSVAVNYGGRWDITQAARNLAKRVAAGEISAEDIDEQMLAGQLSTHGVPDPDLFIRTSGEYRISNFMLWQAAYSEFYFTNTLWPDFDEQAFTEALMMYTHRDRRFGAAQDKPASLNNEQANPKPNSTAQAINSEHA